MKVLIIDNFDSFTFNLYQYVGEILLSDSSNFFLKPELKVVRNNSITLTEIEAYEPTHIILSPGPGTPADRNYFGVCEDVIVHLGKDIPILGVCLGMQGIAHCFGARVVRAPVPMHGKTSRIRHDNTGIFHGLPRVLEVMRYHSLMVEPASVPDCLEITAWCYQDYTKQGESETIIMGLKHIEYSIEGVQFHPESFATEGSRSILSNFLAQRIHGSNLLVPERMYDRV